MRFLEDKRRNDSNQQNQKINNNINFFVTTIEMDLILNYKITTTTMINNSNTCKIILNQAK